MICMQQTKISAKKANSLLTKSTKAGLKFQTCLQKQSYEEQWCAQCSKNIAKMDEKAISLGESFIGVKSLYGINKKKRAGSGGILFCCHMSGWEHI